MASVMVPVNKGPVKESKVELLQLKRWDGKVLVGVFRVTPQGPSAGASQSAASSSPSATAEKVDAVGAVGEFWLPNIIDLQGLKIYKTITELRSNQWGVKSEVGQPMYLWAAFPPVPSGHTINVQPVSAGPIMEGLKAP